MTTVRSLKATLITSSREFKSRTKAIRRVAELRWSPVKQRSALVRVCADVTGGGGSVAALTLPVSDIRTNERIVLFDQQSGLPVAHRGYRAILSDQEITGKTDAEGRIELMRSTSMGEVQILIEPHADAP
jgi:hypothetical protein